MPTVCNIFAGYIFVMWLLWFHYQLRNNNFETPNICGPCFYTTPSSAAIVSALRSTVIRRQLELLTGPYGPWIDARKRQELLRFSVSSTLPVDLSQPPTRLVPRIKRPGRKADQRHIAARLWVSGVKPPLPHIHSWSVRGELCLAFTC